MSEPTPPEDPAATHGAWQASDGKYYSADNQHVWNSGTWQPVSNAPMPVKPKSQTGLVVGLIIGGVVLALCAFCGIGALVAGSNSEDSSSSSSKSPQRSADRSVEDAAPAGLGAPVRDGKFEFTVNEVNCGVSQVGTEYLNATAQGQYCLVNITTKNIGDVPQTFFDSNQYGYGPNGEKFSTDSTASIYSNADTTLWMNEINPGNSLTGVIVFDIPKDGSIKTLELHDSAFSGGVSVQV
ncbi:MAG: DUF4352 domain-containing protein [Corynebacteriales bacterium]|nr:DUF4352 domain-containing protein [Mycobacteriales bacterium]